jgi:hypothetical protein
MLRDAGPPSLIVPNLLSLPSSNEQALLRDAATSAAIDEYQIVQSLGLRCAAEKDLGN